ncbi:hypothetical protein V1264_013248 [Littorina saxatilis]|uniref:Uncharacterized protein n=1 Tax=Littorina saxatilis TaxID=31220 RepID=A0AAN9GHY6_9CAEN
MSLVLSRLHESRLVFLTLAIWLSFVFSAVSVSASWCDFTDLEQENKTTPCGEAQLDLYAGGWTLDIPGTALLNGWSTNRKDVVDNVLEGLGNCAMYKKEAVSKRDCCKGWTGDNCDEAKCDPPCVNGFCAGPNMCNCRSDFGGPTCDEDIRLLSVGRKYCFDGHLCQGEKLLGNVTSETECCDGGGASWGSIHQKICESCGNAMNVTILPTVPADLLFRTCMAAADCRYRTFDGVSFEYCSTCTMTLLRSAALQITSATECDPTDQCQCIKVVTIIQPVLYKKLVFFNGTLSLYNIGGEHVESVENITEGSSVTNLAGVDAEAVGDSIYLVVSAYNVRIRVDSDGMLFLTVDIGHTLGALTGMCGDFDNDLADEIKYAQSPQEAKLLGTLYEETPCGVPLEECVSDEEKNEAQQQCWAFGSRMFSECRTRDVDYNFYNRYCMRSYCSAKRQGMAKAEAARCNAIAIYASECAKNNVVVQWRSADLCPRVCAANMTYQQCGPACRRECGKYLSSYISEECQECVPGCHCAEGLLYMNGTCTPPEDCQCLYAGKYYTQGEVVSTTDNCQSCTCGMYGQWSCNQTDCRASCEVMGHGMMKSFDGETFNIFSNVTHCAFRLVSFVSPSGKGDFYINLLTKPCDTGVGVCISQVQVGSPDGRFDIALDESEVIFVTDVTSSNRLTLPYNNDRFFFKDVTSQTVVVQMEDMRVVFYKSGYVRVDADTGVFYNALQGLCGNLNFMVSDERLLPNGVLADSDDEFIMVNSYLPSDEKNLCGGERGIPTSTSSLPICTELATLYAQKGQAQISESVQDTCIESPVVSNVCPLLLRLADDLQLSTEDIVNTSKHPKLYAMCVEVSVLECAPGLEYRGGVDVCDSFCRDQLYVSSGCFPGVVQGCACAANELKTDDGVCSTLDSCTCFEPSRGVIHQAGDVIHSGCSKCTCEKAKLTCTAADCEQVVCTNGMEVVTNITDVDGECQRPICPLHYSNRFRCAEKIYGTARNCYCPEGTVESSASSDCIQMNECPCYYKGTWYKEGDNITDNCFIKTCQNAMWNVTGRGDCTATCTMAGSQTRYTTWDDQTFQFRGTCTYVLVETINATNPFKVTTQNVACGVEGTSCSRKLEITYAGITLKLIRGLGIQVGNKTYPDDIHKNLGGVINIYPTTLYTVVVFDGVTVYWSGGLVVMLRVTSQWSSMLRGLCGTHDGNSMNDLMMRDGSIASSPNEFGNSWKEAGLTCSDIPVVDIVPDPCTVEPQRKQWSLKTCEMITTSDAFSRCREALPASNVQRFYADCVKEGCSCNSGGDCECMCDAIASFSSRCSEIGYPVRWRHQRLCPIQCDFGKEYQACGNPQQSSCEEPNPSPTSSGSSSGSGNSTACIEGCFCPEGYVMYGVRCIPEERCPCIDDGFIYEEGTTIIKDCMNW